MLVLQVHLLVGPVEFYDSGFEHIYLALVAQFLLIEGALQVEVECVLLLDVVSQLIALHLALLQFGLQLCNSLLALVDHLLEILLIHFRDFLGLLKFGLQLLDAFLVIGLVAG